MGHHRKKRKKSSKSLKEASELIRLKNVVKLNDNDYYSRANEFRAWLDRKHHMKLDDVSDSKQSKKLFSKFVVKWNSGKLNEEFYTGKYGFERDFSLRTNYKWNLKNVNNDLQEVIKDTHKANDSDTRGQLEVCGDENRQDIRKKRKEYWKDQKMVEEELVPKETGRQALIEKKRKRYYREESPDIEADLGGGDDLESFKKRNLQKKARQAEEKEKRASLFNQKKREYDKKEEEKMKIFKEMALRKYGPSKP